MSERYWRAAPLAVLAAVGAMALALAGCSQASTTGANGANGANGAASGAGATGASASTAMSGSPAAGMMATTSRAAFTAKQLRKALLASVNGAKPVGAVEAGNYGSLPDVRLSKESMQGVKVTPARCAQASATGFNSGTFANSPASVETFRKGNDGVSEVLVDASPLDAAAALNSRLPAGCAHYKATVAGKTFSYSVRETTVSGIAEQARALNVRASGLAQVNVWSVVFRSPGLVGAVTLVGPDATAAVAEALAQQAYAKASRDLHR